MENKLGIKKLERKRITKSKKTLSTIRPLTVTSPRRILDCTRALLTPCTREEIQESRRIFPFTASTVSSILRPALLTLGIMLSVGRQATKLGIPELALTKFETLGKKEKKTEKEEEKEEDG